MHRKKLHLNLWIIATVLVGLIIVAYFYLPAMFADDVYPLKYADWIKEYSVKYDVDPALVAAVILQESRFNPDAKSGAGAQGLMQFMPGTAKTMAKETGRWPKYDIFDPETSIEFGAAHLKDLLNKYNGNEDQALAGYNAGTGTVDSWVAANIFDKIINGNGKSETINYVRKVKNYQTVYRTMYAQQLGIGVDASTGLQAMPKTDQIAQVRGLVWQKIFSSVFSIGK